MKTDFMVNFILKSQHLPGLHFLVGRSLTPTVIVSGSLLRNVCMFVCMCMCVYMCMCMCVYLHAYICQCKDNRLLGYYNHKHSKATLVEFLMKQRKSLPLQSYFPQISLPIVVWIPCETHSEVKACRHAWVGGSRW